MAKHDTPAAAIEAASNELRQLIGDHTGQLTNLQAVAAAFRLAAQADEGGGSAALYWPDLIQTLERLIPDSATLDRRIEAVLSSLEQGASASGPATAAPAPARRRTLVADTATQ